MKTFSFLLFLACFTSLLSQNELYINGDEVHIKDNETVFVAGDLHIAGASGHLHEDAAATLEIKGDWYKDAPTIQQTLDGTVLFTGVGAQKIYSGGNGDLTGANTYFTDLLFNNTNGLVYLEGCNIEVKNLLNFINDTRLRTGAIPGPDGMAYSHHVYVSNPTPASITGYLGPGSPRYIEGRLRKEVNAGNTYPLPVGIDMSTSNNTQVATIHFNQGSGVIETGFTYDPGGAITPINACGTSVVCTPDHGYWTVTPISGLTLGGGTVDYDIVLNPGNAASNCSGVSYVVLKDGTYSGTNTCGPNFSNSFTSVPRYNFTSFSTFRIGATMSPLPVELLSFTGNDLSGVNHLYWTTSMEKNASHFEIERSADAVSFEFLTTVQAAGNSDIPVNYTTKDPNPFLNGTYYRLKMLDLDGVFKYSNVIYIGNTLPQLSVSLFPNPFTHSVSIYALNIEESLKIKIYDAAGKEILSRELIASDGIVKEEVDLSKIAIGVYVYTISTNNQVVTGKLLKE